MEILTRRVSQIHPELENELMNFIYQSLPGWIPDLMPMYIAGGFPTAVFITGQTNPGSKYSDLDLYAIDEDSYRRLKAWLERERIVETDRALTARIRNLQVQLMNSAYADPEHIFTEYDYANCCFAIDYNSRNFVFTKQALQAFAVNELQINNIDIIINNFDTPELQIKEIYRVRKYCDRYGLKLSNSLFDLLLETYQNSNIESFVIQETGAIINSTNTYELNNLVRPGLNAWKIIENLLTTHPLWSDLADTHGLFLNSPDNTQFTF